VIANMSQAIVAYHWFDPDVEPLAGGSSPKSSNCNQFHPEPDGSVSASPNRGGGPENRSAARYVQVLAGSADPP